MPEPICKWYEETRISVKHLSAGQPRPYADSVYEAIIQITDAAGTPAKWNREVVLPVARCLVHDWSDKPEFLEPRLAQCENTAPGTWHIKVVQPYAD
jgi:hypothetical protein